MNSSESSQGGGGTDGKVYASYGLCPNGQTGVSGLVTIAANEKSALLFRKNCEELSTPQPIDVGTLSFAVSDRSVFTLNGQVFDQQVNKAVQRVTLEVCQSSGATPAVESLIWQNGGNSTALFGSVTQSDGLGSGTLNVVPPSGASPLDFISVSGQASSFDLSLTSQAGGSLTYTLAGGTQVNVPTMTCLTQPAPGPFPSASNTGVPAGTTLTNSGSITVTVDGTVIDSRLVTGCITVQANNVTIKNTKVLGGTCFEPIHIIDPYRGLLIQDTEIDGQNSKTCASAVGYGGYTLLRANIHGCTDGPHLGGAANITIQDSYIHDLFNDGSTDAIQAYNLNLAVGNSVKITHNTLEGGGNSTIFIADQVSGDLIIDSNLMMGPNFTLRLSNMHVWVTNNLSFDNTGSYYSGYNGPVFTDFGNSSNPGVTIMNWTNNHLTSLRDGSVVGALISQPQP